MRAYVHEYPNGWHSVLFRNMIVSQEAGWCWVLYGKDGEFQGQGKAKLFDEAAATAVKKSGT